VVYRSSFGVIHLIEPLINQTENPFTITPKPSTKNYICQMEVTGALVDKLAHLSRLEFNAADKEEIKNDLQRMISFVEKLDELDLEGTEPLLHMSSNVNVLREDEVKGSVSREEALKNAPSHDDQFFKVPKVIKK
jgi:aspartyl-tRNA(Asn)/glutamyl-tRNA(Gln) amidotransferase subunit C